MVSRFLLSTASCEVPLALARSDVREIRTHGTLTHLPHCFRNETRWESEKMARERRQLHRSSDDSEVHMDCWKYRLENHSNRITLKLEQHTPSLEQSSAPQCQLTFQPLHCYRPAMNKVNT